MRTKGLAFVIAATALVALAVPGGVAAKLTAQLSGGTLTLTGTDGDDTVTIDVVPGIANPLQLFLEITDDGGIDPLPPGCFRKNANAIHCPVELVDGIELNLGDGDDALLVGEDVEEVFDVDGEGGDDEIETGEGRDRIDGGPGRDKLDGDDGPDDREGGPGNDLLKPSAGNDKQSGGAGNDRILGGPGNDRQRGGPGKDKLIGGPGRDKQVGGGGRDRCNGGPGADQPVGCEIGFAY